MLRLLPAAALVLALLAGCGDDVDAANGYVDRLNAVNERFAHTAGRLGDAVTATSSARQDQRTLREYRRAVHDVTARLRRIRAPREVAHLHSAYVRVMADYAERVDRAVAELQAASAPAQAAGAGRRLRRASAEVDAAVNRTIAAINAQLEE